VKIIAWDDCTPAQQLERWENMLRVLVGLTPHERRKHFNMGTWAMKDDCGTVACAAGFCALDPWFRKRGLKIKMTKFSTVFTGRFQDTRTVFPVDFFGSPGYDAILVNPDFTEHKGATIHRRVVTEVRKYIKTLKKGVVDG
jgi:hypothetical protein